MNTPFTPPAGAFGPGPFGPRPGRRAAFCTGDTITERHIPGEKRMANVLVTGSTGFIGGQLCRALCEQGHAVRAFHRPTSLTRVLEAGSDA